MENDRSDLNRMGGFPFDEVRPLRRDGVVEVLEGTCQAGRRVAVKRLVSKRAEQDPIARQRFQREMLIAKVAVHPGIVTCVQAEEDWIAFEWLSAGLDEPAVQQRFLSAAAIRSLLRQLAETLAYLHGRGITHADIKPAHVRFRGDEPVLIDFGIAATGEQDPIVGQELAGSPRWMAPEVLAGAPPEPASDVWSLCAVAAWLANGCPANLVDADTILEMRREYTMLPEHGVDTLNSKDRGLHAILTAGLGPQVARPSAANLAYLISRSTAG